MNRLVDRLVVGHILSRLVDRLEVGHTLNRLVDRLVVGHTLRQTGSWTSSRTYIEQTGR